uniref:Uncharacterized protein n=1 Tax=Rhizophora mucronata TaxID=61149 RepID=A0A2P2N264_RHIMU
MSHSDNIHIFSSHILYNSWMNPHACQQSKNHSSYVYKELMRQYLLLH